MKIVAADMVACICTHIIIFNSPRTKHTNSSMKTCVEKKQKNKKKYKNVMGTDKKVNLVVYQRKIKKGRPPHLIFSSPITLCRLLERDTHAYL